jgi:NAD dependent epimerase/dehydratase family
MDKALVAGALGVTGRSVVNHLVSLGSWEVIGLSRRHPEFRTEAQFIALDLLNRSEVQARLSAIGDVSHIFYAALQPGANIFEEVAPNLAMLANLVETVEKASPRFRKIVLIEGAKFYFAHLGPYKTPAKETDPRHMPPNFYYNQEDYLNERSAGKAWSWTALRPSSICGFAVGNPMNMATVIAVYAALCKEMKLPLRFPGSATSYHAIMEMTDADWQIPASRDALDFMNGSTWRRCCSGSALSSKRCDSSRDWEESKRSVPLGHLGAAGLPETSRDGLPTVSKASRLTSFRGESEVPLLGLELLRDRRAKRGRFAYILLLPDLVRAFQDRSAAGRFIHQKAQIVVLRRLRQAVK